MNEKKCWRRAIKTELFMNLYSGIMTDSKFNAYLLELNEG